MIESRSAMFADVSRVWRRHERSRASGMPVVSVWLGDADEWTAALCAADRELVWSTGTCIQQIARDWWSAISARRNLEAESFAFIARALGIAEADLRTGWAARGVRERQMWSAQLCAPQLTQAIALFEGVPVIDDYTAAIRGLCAWLPQPPCLGVRGGAAIDELLALAMNAPHLSLVACLEPTEWTALLPALDDRSRTLLEHGLIPRVAASPTIQAEALQEAYAAASSAHARGDRDAPELASRARSKAEQRLYDLLQADVVTRDLFELNVQMPFTFGPGRAEVDLACVSLRVAVEVDGFHHFREFDAYRRDRRKDVLLQHQGYLVSRHLADDVRDRPREVVRAIRKLVQRRQRQRRREEDR